MKKVKYLLLILLSLLILPFGVYAEGEEEAVAEDSREVVVYFFRGEGCSHCAEAEAWFESIEEDMGDKFRIQDYETWYNEDNAALMKKVAEARGEADSATGVPYIIIGDQSWIGFDQDYTPEMIDKINTLYDQEVNERYDIMTYVDQNVTPKEEKQSVASDIIALIIIIVITGGVGTGIYFARKANKE